MFSALVPCIKIGGSNLNKLPMISLGKRTKLTQDCLEKIFWFFPLGRFFYPGPDFRWKIFIHFNKVAVFTPFPVGEFFFNSGKHIQKMFDFLTVRFVTFQILFLAFFGTIAGNFATSASFHSLVWSKIRNGFFANSTKFAFNKQIISHLFED